MDFFKLLFINVSCQQLQLTVQENRPKEVSFYAEIQAVIIIFYSILIFVLMVSVFFQFFTSPGKDTQKCFLLSHWVLYSWLLHTYNFCIMCSRVLIYCSIILLQPCTCSLKVKRYITYPKEKGGEKMYVYMIFP